MRLRHRSLIAAAAATMSIPVAAGVATASTPGDGIEITPEALVAAADLSASTPQPLRDVHGDVRRSGDARDGQR